MITQSGFGQSSKWRIAADLAELASTCGLRSAEVALIQGLIPGSATSPCTKSDQTEKPWQLARSLRLAQLLVAMYALLGAETAVWLRKANAALGYRSPISVLLGEADALPILERLLHEEAMW